MTDVVVTGIGVVAPNGWGVAEYWDATLAGRSGLGPLTRFDSTGYRAHVAGEVNFTPEEHLPGRLLPQTDHMTRLALVAAEEALADAGADPTTMPDFSAGVVTAASAGGFEFGQKELQALWSKGPAYVSAYQSFAWFYPVNTGQISIRHGMRGPGSALVAEQAGGLDALAKARRHVREGTALMLAGAVDGSLCPWSWLCLSRSGTVSPRRDPQRAFLPFDADASGGVPGEGGALLVLETPDGAAERGQHRHYGRIAGYAATFDPRPGSGRPPGLRRAIDTALADAGIGPSDVDVVFADASGVAEQDRAEAEVLGAVFGPRGVPVTAPKTMTGRLLAGGAPLDVAAALLSLRDGVIPPSVHIGRPAHPDLDLVRDRPRPARLGSALVLARGHGGFNSALVLTS
ncbi:ketosynthase chain-length factor [Kitasatospora aureofaciens]|uniref:Beta-ketoacyl synthase n=1 Tax=Kitasatospora aureofaciens TaxID=1894 RepID=Q9FAR4_KITAU|nr:ketosynthase chain-length factor [Kitasatospora aureofaciens]ARF80627.1 ketosynthase chain-length factor [Kitasatospora aureofaciens]OEV33523.1 beta-ketoacyl synthase [Kitasatospora aureofaciens]BAB12567.1 beta-ketoacyl synthase2 [Kitasatospora aureofaciens]GGU60709.1 actinorhodin polyketide putative beta-ketoacyl synthase 2 [Kitasatospora aureofaciens]